MKISLHLKLFVATLSAILLVVVYMSLVMQWSFDRGFLNYVNTVELEQLNTIGRDLESYYKTQKNWDDLSNDPTKMALIIVASFPEGQLKERILEKLRSGELDKRFVPKGPLPNDLPPHFLPRVFLLDEKKKVIWGYDPGNGKKELINLNYQNRPVGYLGVHPAKDITNSHQVVFAKQQKLTLFLAAIAGFLLAAGLSLPIAYRLTKPIRGLAKATRDLSIGRYDTRIDITASDEFGKLSQDFNHLAATLEKNQQARSQWVADISHELRTPLSVLRGRIEALQDGVYKPTKEMFSGLHQEVHHLTMLVEDLYQLSLSDMGAMSYHRVEVKPCWALEQAIATLMPQIERRGLTFSSAFDIEDGTSLFADNERLMQLFTNLLANSIRYTNEGGRIEVDVHQKDNSILYDIQDSAPAVNDEHLPKLFERLYRVDSSRSRDLGGAGLGLSICYNIARGHNGTIEANHSSLGGLWIRVTLPMSE